MHIMGLADRLKAYQEEQATRQAAEIETTSKKLQLAEEQRLLELAEQQRWQAQEKATNARMGAELSRLLKVIDAQGQLEEVRKFWGVGEVSSQSELASYVSKQPGGYYIRKHFKGLGPALRYQYPESEKIYWDYYEGGSSRHFQTGLGITQATLQVLVSLDLEDTPSVTTIYEKPGGFADYSVFPRAVKASPIWSPRTSLDNSLRIFERTDIIDPSNANLSRRKLEDQLLELVTHPNIYASPLDLAAKAREEITADRYIPQNIRNRIASGSTAINPPWYRKILG